MTMQETRIDTSTPVEPQNRSAAWKLISPSEENLGRPSIKAWGLGAGSDVKKQGVTTFDPADIVPKVKSWQTDNNPSSVTTTGETRMTVFVSGKEWWSTSGMNEAKLRFKDALEDAADDEEDAPSDTALTNALRAVQMMDAHCPQDVSSTVVLDGGFEATVRGGNRNYISVECHKDGEVLVMFNVRSYARYKGMDEAEREGFLKALLETLRY